MVLKGLKQTTDLPQVADKLYHIILYTSPWSRFKLTTSVVIGTDRKGSCKSNYYTITTTTDPVKQIIRCVECCIMHAWNIEKRNLIHVIFHSNYNCMFTNIKEHPINKHDPVKLSKVYTNLNITIMFWRIPILNVGGAATQRCEKLHELNFSFLYFRHA
jgi:hypothetical protein